MSDPVTTLLSLQRRARTAETTDELGFIAVNETHILTSYRQAALWEEGVGVRVLSGVSSLDDNAPFVLWLNRFCQDQKAKMAGGGVVERSRTDPLVVEDWDEWLPEHIMWQPFRVGRSGPQMALLLARETVWEPQDTVLLYELVMTYGHAWGALYKPTLLSSLRLQTKLRRRVQAGVGIALLLAAVVPVRLTVLAPADVVAASPAVIHAPLDGVVKKVHVHPNDRVQRDQPLFDLDDTVLRGKAEVAAKALATSEAELRQFEQQALFDPTAKPKLAVAAGRRDEMAAELANLTSLQERIHVRAPREGIAVIDDPSHWIGRPVVVGERVMEIAEERDTEIEAWLSPADIIDLPVGAGLTLFLNVDPLRPVAATVRMVGYEASLRPDNSYAYRVRAAIAGEDIKPRLGLKGTARISGDRVPLIYWVLRRPLAAVRAMLGI